MEPFQLLLLGMTSLFLFSTVAIGLKMRFSNAAASENSRLFHMVSGILAACFSMITILIFAVV